MFGLVHEKLDDDKYRVEFYNLQKYSAICKWTAAEIRAKIAEGLCIGGVSDEEIILYSSYEEYIEAESIKMQLYDADWADGIFYLAVEEYRRTGIPYCSMCMTHTRDVNIDELSVPECVLSLDLCGDSLENKYKQPTTIRSLILPDSLECFEGLVNLHLQSVRFPTEVAEIPKKCLAETTTLQTVILPKNVRRGIEFKAFEGCTGLRELVLPEQVDYIESFAFAGCKGLQTIKFGKVTGYIGLHAFAKCAVQELDLPRGIERFIWGRAFADCARLQRVRMYSYDRYSETKVVDIGGANEPFPYCPATTRVRRATQAMESSPFHNCKKLTDVEVLDGGSYL